MIRTMKVVREPHVNREVVAVVVVVVVVAVVVELVAVEVVVVAVAVVERGREEPAVWAWDYRSPRPETTPANHATTTCKASPRQAPRTHMQCC